MPEKTEIFGSLRKILEQTTVDEWKEIPARGLYAPKYFSARIGPLQATLWMDSEESTKLYSYSLTVNEGDKVLASYRGDEVKQLYLSVQRKIWDHESQERAENTDSNLARLAQVLADAV